MNDLDFDYLYNFGNDRAEFAMSVEQLHDVMANPERYPEVATSVIGASQ